MPTYVLVFRPGARLKLTPNAMEAEWGFLMDETPENDFMQTT